MVAPDDRLSRFVCSKSHVRFAVKKVKHAAFLPMLEKNRWETSVYCSITLTEPQIWEIGRNYVEKLPERKVKGRADLKASVCFNQKLQIEPVPEPHPLHAVLVNWPGEANQQEDRIAVAQVLAREALFVEVK